MPSARALIRMLMSFDTRITLRFGWLCDRCITTAMIWLSALPPASDAGSAVEMDSVCRNSRPVAAPLDLSDSGMPLAMASPVSPAAVTSSSRKRLTWRALRATSVMPFLLLSSSSSVRIGR